MPYSALKTLFTTSKTGFVTRRAVTKITDMHLNHVRFRNFLYSNKRWMLWYLNEI